MPIRVLVVEPQEFHLRGLELALPCADIIFVAGARVWLDAMKLLTHRRVDVILVDPVAEATKIFTDMDQLKWVNPKVKTLFFTDLTHPAYYSKTIACGGKGIVSKNVTVEDLQAAIRKIHRGESLWQPDDTKRCPPAMLAKLQFDKVIPLSAREKSVLALIAAGHSNKDTALKLNLSYEMVKESVQQLLKKLGVEDRTQAALWGLQHELF